MAAPALGSRGTQRRIPNAATPHARPRGVDAGALERLLDGWGQQRPTTGRKRRLAARCRPRRRPPSRSAPTGSTNPSSWPRSTPRLSRPTATPSIGPAIGLGTRKVTAAALESGQFDLKPEYIGSGLAYYDATKTTGDPAANAAALQAILTGKGGGITVLDYSPAADQNAFVVTQATATKYHLAKMSDLTAVQGQLKFGVATDCSTNPVCAAAIKTAYGIDLSNALPLSACDQPMVDALTAGTIQVGELCSTQPDIAQNGWVVLTDDKQTQPADNIAPLVRNDLLAKVDKAELRADPQRRLGQDDDGRADQAQRRVRLRQEGHRRRSPRSG